MAGDGSYGISGSIADIARIEKLQGSIGDMQRNIEQRSMHTAFTNKAIGLRGYEAAQRRIDQIESLMDKINDTQDPKAIGELQARISAEQALLQNESNKLQMISQLQIAEQNLIEEQKRQMSRRIWNSKNTKMPRIK
jgi:type IV secretion system protein VirB5